MGDSYLRILGAGDGFCFRGLTRINETNSLIVFGGYAGGTIDAAADVIGEYCSRQKSRRIDVFADRNMTNPSDIEDITSRLQEVNPRLKFIVNPAQ